MLNKAILMGRLTRDPELRYTGDSNIPVVSFTLAVDRGYARQGEEKQTDFIPITAWRGTAEFVSRNFTKGQLVAVTGRIQVRNYQDKDGNNRTATNVVADEVFFAEPKRNNSGAPGSAPAFGGGAYNAPADDGFMSVDTADDLPF